MIGSELSFNRITLKCVNRMWARGGAKTEVRRTIRSYTISERGMEALEEVKHFDSG